MIFNLQAILMNEALLMEGGIVREYISLAHFGNYCCDTIHGFRGASK